MIDLEMTVGNKILPQVVAENAMKITCLLIEYAQCTMSFLICISNVTNLDV